MKSFESLRDIPTEELDEMFAKATYEAGMYEALYDNAAKQREKMARALEWIIANPGAHPANMVAVARDALSSG